MQPHLQAYAVQMEKVGISVAEASAYVAGWSDLPEPADAMPAPAATQSASSGTASAQAPTNGDYESWKIVDEVAEYRIGPQDVIEVIPQLGPEPVAARTHRVQADGMIFVPRFEIGAIGAAGLTATELSRRLTDKYRRYVPSAYVDVRVREYNAWTATLVGEIRVGQNIGPGTYQLRGRETTADFIFRHGGPTANADLSDVRLVRDGVETRFDLAGALGGQGGANPYVDDGDVIRVLSSATGSSRYFVFGEVRRPGVFTVTEGLTALDAIAQAGSLTAEAKANGVYVSRPTTGEVLPLDLDSVLGEAAFNGDLPVQAGDFIVVPRRDRTFWEKTRDWLGLTTLIISTVTVIELIRRD